MPGICLHPMEVGAVELPEQILWQHKTLEGFQKSLAFLLYFHASTFSVSAKVKLLIQVNSESQFYIEVILYSSKQPKRPIYVKKMHHNSNIFCLELPQSPALNCGCPSRSSHVLEWISLQQSANRFQH